MARKKTRRSSSGKRKARRFTDACRKKFKACMLDTLRSSGSFRTAGKQCMSELHTCAGHHKRKTRKARR